MGTVSLGKAYATFAWHGKHILSKQVSHVVAKMKTEKRKFTVYKYLSISKSSNLGGNLVSTKNS